MTVPDDIALPAAPPPLALLPGRRLDIFGAPEGQDAFVLGRLAAMQGASGVLHVCRDDGRMARLAAALAFFDALAATLVTALRDAALYGRLVERARRIVAEEHHQLLESLAGSIAMSGSPVLLTCSSMLTSRRA